MKREVFYFLALVVVCLIFSVHVGAITDIPQWTDRYVNDFGGILDSAQSSELRGLFYGVDNDTSAEVVFVSVTECSPYSSGDLAVKMLNSWGVGKKDKNNGLLILYCVGEKKIFAATGYGLEGILPDSKVGRLLDENYVPLRDSGNVSQGIVGFSQAISNVIEQNREEVLSGKAGGSNGSTSIIVFVAIIFLIIGLIIFFKVLARKKSEEKKASIVAEEGKGRIYGIKKDSYSGFLSFGIIIAAFIVAFLTDGSAYFYIIFLLLVICLNPLIKWIRGVRCAKDGKRMKHVGKKGKYQLYKCPDGHIGGIAVASAAAWYFASGAGHGSGGFGGGGFGGGGFGGGGGGGGGAGR